MNSSDVGDSQKRIVEYYSKSLCKTLFDMTGREFRPCQQVVEHHSYTALSLVTIHMHFAGAIQGDFIMSLHPDVCASILGLKNSYLTSDLELELMKEVLNVVVLQCLFELEKIHGELTATPPLICIGNVFFPEVKTYFIQVEGECGLIRCALAINQVSTRSDRRLQQALVLLEEKSRIANIDYLTGLYTRKYIESALTKWLVTPKDREPTLFLLMLDIDYFKKLNDTFGHLVGDDAIKLVANILKSAAGDTHIAARFGGDEMLMLMNSVDKKQALAIAEDIGRKCTLLKNFEHLEKNSEEPKLTVSIGCVQCHIGDSVENIFKKVDTALYHSKELGRNRVYFLSDAEEKLMSEQNGKSKAH